MSKKYIGQTGRTLAKPIKEHKESFLYNKIESYYANDQFFEHNIFSSNSNILHIKNKGIRFYYLESFINIRISIY